MQGASSSHTLLSGMMHMLATSAHQGPWSQNNVHTENRMAPTAASEGKHVPVTVPVTGHATQQETHADLALHALEGSRVRGLPGLVPAFRALAAREQQMYRTPVSAEAILEGTLGNISHSFMKNVPRHFSPPRGLKRKLDFEVESWQITRTRPVQEGERGQRAMQEGPDATLLKVMRCMPADIRSQYALELEKKALLLLVEEGLEMKRLLRLDVLPAPQSPPSSPRTPPHPAKPGAEESGAPEERRGPDSNPGFRELETGAKHTRLGVHQPSLHRDDTVEDFTLLNKTRSNGGLEHLGGLGGCRSLDQRAEKISLSSSRQYDPDIRQVHLGAVETGPGHSHLSEGPTFMNLLANGREADSARRNQSPNCRHSYGSSQRDTRTMQGAIVSLEENSFPSLKHRQHRPIGPFLSQAQSLARLNFQTVTTIKERADAVADFGNSFSHWRTQDLNDDY